MNASTAALTAALLAFAATPIGVLLTGWQRRRDKLQDWERQDIVAGRVADVAAAAEALRVETRDQLTKIQDTGEQTRRFVDGAYTGQLSGELAVQRALAAMTQHTLSLIKAAGDTPAPQIAAVLAGTEARIKVLEPLIAERTRHMDNLAEAALAKINAEPTK